MKLDPSPLRVHVQGAGKAGRTLTGALRRAGWTVTLRAARRGRPVASKADVIVLAVRDGQLLEEANAWIRDGALPKRAVVLHLAGAMGPEILTELREWCRGVAQMHPLVSMASHRRSPDLHGVYVLVSGDPAAVRAAGKIANAVGMRKHRGDGVDRTAYHAAAWLVAGGTVALCWAARDFLVQAGISSREAERMLAPLVRSVGANVGSVGLPNALTGVVRRGDVDTLQRHLSSISILSPQHLKLYQAAALGQMPMARTLDEAPREALERLQAVLDRLSP